MSSSPDAPIILSTQGKIAIITLNLPKKLNALTQDLYYELAMILRTVAEKPEIYITILTGRGRFFSAGADVTQSTVGTGTDIRRSSLQTFVANNLDVTNAFYTHPKILITALNGPVVGLSAALIAYSDFIYAHPSTFLLTPFTSLGLVAEGGASYEFVRRLGVAKANEALIMSKRLSVEELVGVGFVNKVFDAEVGTGTGGGEGQFLGKVMEEVEDRLGAHLNDESLVRVKELIRRPHREILDKANFEEVMGGLRRFSEGVPQEELARTGRGEKRHKL
ncbi:uncharacterized protein KY384_003559 [Bacidia gigantensis]|uniref:uncharacterized protein n=1 Tax=Bacidia gigantensis TaxID=2732470 RepID=UPI001D043C15|nr:uncharacterized protein KY384_003559 [Bacidia gigantensis]KAG8531923.1 hypothetical protein KY384_003559 [Bacidia gigantensis]